MDAAAEIGRNPVSTIFSLSMEMSRLTQDGFAEPLSRDKIVRRVRGQVNIQFACSADHEQIGHLITRLILILAMCDDHTYTCASASIRGYLILSVSSLILFLFFSREVSLFTSFLYHSGSLFCIESTLYISFRMVFSTSTF